ncbi:MAG: hypothetical protein H6728_09475 [Myxococcales bacterium]|nr:hypothetical protein [Myxococcales bacterium]
MSDKLKLRDAGLARAYEALNQNQINKDDAQKLIDAANDGGKVTSLEKEELGWVLYKHQDNFTADARAHLAESLGVTAQNGRIPMPSLYLRDTALRKELGKALSDSNISKSDVLALLDAARDGGKITTTERGDLLAVLNRLGDKFDGEARASLADALGVTVSTPDPVTPPTPPTPQTPPKSVSSLLGNPRGITDISEFADKFRTDLEAAKAELVGHPGLNDDQKADRMFEFFKPYGEQFHRLSQHAGSVKTKEALAAVEAQLKDVGFGAVLNKDDDKDGMSMAKEIMRGTDPKRFSAVADTQTWTTTYWPMAGSYRDADGDVDSHLWAKGGALDKLDQLNRDRGNTSGAKALEFERKPALNWLIGSNDKGHYIPDSNLRETDAERTTGVDFDGDGRISANVKVDFLDSQGNFSAVNNRNNLVPKLEGETLSRKMVTENNETSVKYFRADGSEVTGSDRDRVVLTNPNADGKADKTMDVGWWGSCDKVALAGILFEQPVKDSVTVDGVTFTKQDMLGLLTVLADSQANGTDFAGSRYDDRPDILVTKDGKQIQGKLITDGVEFETSDMWRWNGDYMVLNSVDKEIKFQDFATGETKTFPADQIKHLAREDEKDMSAADFNATVMDWLKSGRAASMDRDSGDHVWNYNFWKAERAEVDKPWNVQDAKDLRGFNGEVKNPDNVKFFETDIYFGESNYPRTYRYWVETDTSGKEINSGWNGENPDFLWRPTGFNNWSGTNDRNPYVTPTLVKEIYDKFFE